jgi:hypothetical protein
MTSTWDSLDTEAEKVKNLTKQQLPEICLVLKDAISTLADGFLEAEVKSGDAAQAQQGLYSQNLNSLKCSVDLAMQGYYTQSTGLLRGVYENWIAFHYLSDFPLKAKCWLNKNSRPPGHSVMLNSLGPDFVENKKDARNWYGALCRFAHTDALVVLPHLGSHQGEPCAFVGVMFKPDLFRTCAYSISLFTSIMLREISKMISPDSDWQQRFTQNIELLLKFIETENADFESNLEK